MTALLGLAILDQVDGPGALVELADGDLVELPISCLPADPREGEPLRVRRRADEGCPFEFRRPLSIHPGARVPTSNRSHP